MQQMIFIADLIACSTCFGHHYAHHQELENINLKTKAPNTRGCNHLYNTLELLMMGIMVPETCWASNKICYKKHLLHLVGILFSHINDDARSESLQILKDYSLLPFNTTNTFHPEENNTNTKNHTVFSLGDRRQNCSVFWPRHRIFWTEIRRSFFLVSPGTLQHTACAIQKHSISS